MKNDRDYRTIEAGMIRGRTLRAQAFLALTQKIAGGLRRTARALIAMVA